MAHESREHKRRYEKFQKQVELDGDNEARSGKQGGGSRWALIRAVFDRLRFQNLHDERLLEAQVEKRELPSIQFQIFTRRRKW